MKIKKIFCMLMIAAMVLMPCGNIHPVSCSKGIVQAKEPDTAHGVMKKTVKSSLVKNNVRLYASNKKYKKYKTVSKAAVGVRNDMVNHNQQIVTYVKSTNSDPVQVFEALEEEVFKETENGYEGDYLQWDIDREYPSYTYFSAKSGGKTYYYYEFCMEIWYFTTLTQKKQVDEKVKEIIYGFQFSEDTSDYEKVRTIYDYVCENVTYAQDINKDIVYTSWSALFNGEAVCQGYAQLIYRMLKEVGISVRVIPGYGGSDVTHGWNIVKLGDYYYNLDSTWDAEMLAATGSYRYFLKGDNFENHTRMTDYRTSEFYNSYPMAEKDYGSEQQNASFATRKARFNVIKPKFKKVTRKKVTLRKVSGASRYIIQYSTDKKFKKSKKTVTTKKNLYKLKALKKSQKYYIRFRAYRYLDGKKVYTSWSSKKTIKV